MWTGAVVVGVLGMVALAQPPPPPNPPNGSPKAGVPAQAVMVDPRSFAAVPSNFNFRTNIFSTFNPTNTTSPFFQVFHPDFLTILGPNARINEVARNNTFAFAHEAPIYDPTLDTVFFASNDGGALGMSDLNHNNVVNSISMKEVEQKLANAGTNAVSVTVTQLNLPDTVQMTNGGTGPVGSDLLLITSGRGPRPPSIVRVNPLPPHNATVLLNNFFGRQFNSLNDIKVHPGSGIFVFTDPTYGFINNFRPAPLIDSQVYAFNPADGTVRVVATDFDKPNGIAFNKDGTIGFVTDTGAVGGQQTEPSTIYSFDVDPDTLVFKNRRVFAFIDSGIPDGIQVDANGNVYSGCGDGVHVWNSRGILLGKFFLNTVSANMAFAGNGRLVIMAETAVFVAHTALVE